MEYEFAQMDSGMTNKEQKRKVKEGRIIGPLPCTLEIGKGWVTDCSGAFFDIACTMNVFLILSKEMTQLNKESSGIIILYISSRTHYCPSPRNERGDETNHVILCIDSTP